MKRWKFVVKDVIERYLCCFALTLVGLMFGVNIALIFKGISIEIFFQVLFDMSLVFLSTIFPYFIALVGMGVWYLVELIVLLRLRIKHPSITFTLNDFLSVRFVSNKTVIYVTNKPFKMCKYLLMNVPLSEVYDYESIDQASEFYSKQLEYEITPKEIGLSSEEEFKGHCSNLQVWAENNYDTCLLHQNLAFPLLKRLSDVGDPVAKEALVQEIIRRFKSKSTSVQLFLIQQGFLRFLKEDYHDDLFQYVVDKQVLFYLAGYYKYSKHLLLEIKALNFLVQADSINYLYNMGLANRYLKNKDARTQFSCLEKSLRFIQTTRRLYFFLLICICSKRRYIKRKKHLVA